MHQRHNNPLQTNTARNLLMERVHAGIEAERILELCESLRAKAEASRDAMFRATAIIQTGKTTQDELLRISNAVDIVSTSIATLATSLDTVSTSIQALDTARETLSISVEDATARINPGSKFGKAFFWCAAVGICTFFHPAAGIIVGIMGLPASLLRYDESIIVYSQQYLLNTASFVLSFATIFICLLDAETDIAFPAQFIGTTVASVGFAVATTATHFALSI